MGDRTNVWKIIPTGDATAGGRSPTCRPITVFRMIDCHGNRMVNAMKASMFLLREIWPACDRRIQVAEWHFCRLPLASGVDGANADRL